MIGVDRLAPRTRAIGSRRERRITLAREHGDGGDIRLLSVGVWELELEHR